MTAKFIASISRESPRGFSTGYYVKESSPIRSVADLKGKTVGINGFSTAGHLWLKAALDKHGLVESDMRITPVPFAAMQEALDAGKIDLGQFPQPFAALAEKQMKVRKIFDAKYGVPFEEELTVVVGKDAFLKKHAAAVRALLEDLTASMRFYLDHPRQARQALIDARMVQVAPDVYMTMQDYYRDPTLRVDADALERMQAFQFKAGFQKRAPMSGRWSISAICRNEAADKYAAAPLRGRAARSDDPIRNRSSSGDSTCAEVAMARCADWRVLWRCWLRAQARRWHKAPPCGSATARRRKSPYGWSSLSLTSARTRARPTRSTPPGSPARTSAGRRSKRAPSTLPPAAPTA